LQLLLLLLRRRQRGGRTCCAASRGDDGGEWRSSRCVVLVAASTDGNGERQWWTCCTAAVALGVAGREAVDAETARLLLASRYRAPPAERRGVRGDHRRRRNRRCFGRLAPRPPCVPPSRTSSRWRATVQVVSRRHALQRLRCVMVPHGELCGCCAVRATRGA
jgi:hypothetical protein